MTDSACIAITIAAYLTLANGDISKAEWLAYTHWAKNPTHVNRAARTHLLNAALDARDRVLG